MTISSSTELHSKALDLLGFNYSTKSLRSSCSSLNLENEIFFDRKLLMDLAHLNVSVQREKKGI